MNDTVSSATTQVAPAPHAIETRSVAFEIGGRALLDGVSVTISPGEYVAVMGRNGSGKTTLIRHFNGLLLPTSGECFAFGLPTRDPRCLREIRRRIGLVFQDPDDQMVAVTVEDEIAFGLENRAVPPEEMDQRVEAVLDIFHLQHVRKRSTSALSGGEQQRVAIAAVWATNPDVLVLDEPTSMLDLVSSVALLELLNEIRGSKAVVHVTQNLQEAARAERLIVMDEGRIVFDGPPQQALEESDSLRRWGIAAAGRPASRNTPPGTSIAISTEALNHVRDDGNETNHVLKDVTFQALRGSVLAIVGKSGSGKTTLAYHFNRLLEPTSGEVRIGERPAHSIALHELRRIVGLTFQRVDLQLFEASVLDDVAFGLVQRGMERAEAYRRARLFLHRMGLDPDSFGNRAPGTLSTGEKRRVALAGVLVSEPEVIVLDEPTSGLDAASVEQLSEIVSELANQGKTLLIITHDLNFAARTADGVILVDEGRAEVLEGTDRLGELAATWLAETLSRFRSSAA
ncbi:MAG TPA: energy-coupling factor transporter ATPase [Candidatus Latescibacteria bacterium]|nr:energy-coupling factor transporter ATPase [Candidatus Latescibacterota bacterium]